MVSRETVGACLDAAAAELKEMSYEELERFAESHGMFGDWKRRELEHDSVTVEVFMLAGKLGHIRKRISIEITLSTVAGEAPERTYCRYFERYQSGRFYPSPREEARDAVLAKVFPYALVGLATIMLLGLAWFLVGRGN